MSVKARTEAVNRDWADWRGSLVNGTYPLREILHASEQSAIFRTEARSHNTPDAAIKIVRPGAVLADLQLRQWKTAAALSHPHLMRILDSGHCQLGDQPFLFVVMEYAEQTLAQVLPGRALTPEEAREMLLPALEVLDFLHRRNLVHGQLKPANFLVVGDQLKLASDTVRAVGAPRPGSCGASLYDPPEAKDGRFTTAGDIWGLGVTTVEALTQALPWPDRQSQTAALPATIPAAFAPTLLRCLSHDPASRPTAAELASQLKGSAAAPIVSAPVIRELPRRAAPAPQSPQPPSSVPAIAVTALLTLVVVILLSLRVFHGHAGPDTGRTEQSVPPPVAPALPATQSPASPQAAPRFAAPSSQKAHAGPAPARAAARPTVADPASGVTHSQLPAVAHSALRTIHGHLKVGVLVIVDRSGSVIDALLEEPGPSPYFARLARDAARQWQFAAADGQDTRQWLLRFEFTRDGVTGHAIPRP